MAEGVAASDLAHLLCHAAAFLQAVEPHGAQLQHFEDWLQHDGLHFPKGTWTFSHLFASVESPRALLQATPNDEAVCVGVSSASSSWYLRFRLVWDDEGYELSGSFALVIPPNLAARFQEEVSPRTPLRLHQTDSESYYQQLGL